MWHIVVGAPPKNYKTGSKNDKLSNKYLKTKLESFIDHVQYIQNQFTILRNLKENLGQIMYKFMWILKNIIDDTQKRKSYWSQVQVTTHPVVPYYKPNEQLIHSRTSIWCKIYICSHSITDSPVAKPYILPNVELVHYCQQIAQLHNTKTKPFSSLCHAVKSILIFLLSGIIWSWVTAQGPVTHLKVQLKERLIKLSKIVGQRFKIHYMLSNRPKIQKKPVLNIFTFNVLTIKGDLNHSYQTYAVKSNI